MVTTLASFQRDIAHITISLLFNKAGTELEKRGVSGGLLNDYPKALECILLDLFNAKLHVHSLVSHIQRIGYAYFGRIRVYLGPCQTSMLEPLVKSFIILIF